MLRGQNYVLSLGLVIALLSGPVRAATDSSPNHPAAGDSAAPQNTLKEVVVTAERRSENITNVPFVVNAFSSRTLRDANVHSLSDITKLTPGVRFDNAAMFVQPSIRGVGTDVVTSGVGSNVGIYIDGFYNPNPTSVDFDLLNVTGIQVLKGPQGTLFGRNTTGGAILVTTASPSLTPAGTLQVSYGSFNTVRTEGYVTGGLTDKLAGDLAVLYTRSDGYYQNLITGSDTVGASHSYTIRTGLKYLLSDSSSVLVRYEHIHEDDPTNVLMDTYVGRNGPVLPLGTPPSTVTTQPWKTVQIAPQQYFRDTSDILQVTIPVHFSWGTLTSYSQARYDDTPSMNDLAGTANSNLDLGIRTRDTTYTQELLATSSVGRFKWTTGVFGFFNRDTFRAPADVYTDTAYSHLFLVAPAGSSTTSITGAAYFDGTYEFARNWFFTAGVRYSYDEVTDAYYLTANGFPAPGANGILYVPQGVVPVPGLSSNHVTPRAVIRWKPTESSSIYASFSEGYKAAVLNVGCGCSTAGIPAQSEKLNDYEVGYKYGGTRFSGSVGGFYYDYRNLQVAYYTYQAGTIVNAPKARIDGIEAQGDYQVLSGLTLGADVSYLDAVYEDYPQDNTYVPTVGGIATTNTVDGKGLTLQRAPKWSGNASVRYTRGIGYGSMTFAGTYSYSSRIYFDPADEFYQNAYGLLSLRAAWTDPSGRFTVAAYGDNVTNEAYIATVSYDALGINSQWGAPATWGLSFKVQY